MSDTQQPIQPYDYGAVQPYNADPAIDYTIDPNALPQYDVTQQSLDPYYGYETTTTVAPRRRSPLLFIAIGIALLVLLVFIFLLISSRSRTNTPTNTQNNTGKNVIIQWWGAFMDADIVKPLIEEYQTLNPTVKIEYANKVPNNVNGSDAKLAYRNELNRILNTNDPVQLPDIFMIENTWVGDYEAYTQPSTTTDFATFQNSYYPAVVSDFASKGIVFGVPLWIDTIAIVFNKDFLEQVQLSTPPVEWFDFKATAQNLTRYAGNEIERSGFAFGDITNTTYFFESVLALIRQNNVDLTDATGQPVFSQNSDTLDALEFFKSFTGNTNPTWNSNFQSDAAAFLEQKAAMIIATSSRLREIMKYNDAASLGLEIGVSLFPQLDSESEPIYWATYWGNMVSKTRPNAAASWQFLNWLSQPDQLKKLHANIKDQYGYFGTLYPRKDMSSELQNDTYLKAYNQSLPNAETWYMIKGIELKNIFIELLGTNNINTTSIKKAEDSIKELIVLRGILEQGE